MAKKDEIIQSDLALRIKSLRKILKVTGKDMAKAVGISHTAMVRYESGEYTINTNLIKALHDVYRMSYEWFFEGTGQPLEGTEKKSTSLLSDVTVLADNDRLLALEIKRLKLEFKNLHREVYAMKNGVSN